MQKFIIDRIETLAAGNELVYLETHRFANLGMGYLKSPDGMKTYNTFHFRYDEKTATLNEKDERGEAKYFSYDKDDDMKRFFEFVFKGCPNNKS